MILTLSQKGIRILCFVACLLCVLQVRAQDPQFTQYYANPIYTNPAFAGSSTVARGVLNYRSQWPGISGTFNTYSASYDEHFDAIKGGIGILLVGDEAGVGTLRTTSLSGIYSYQININKYLTVRASIQGGLQQKAIDFGKLQFYDQIIEQQGFVNPTQEQPITNNPTYANFATGFIAYTSKFYGGFAAHNITEPNQGFYASTRAPVPMRYTAHAGLIIPLTRNNSDLYKSTNLWPNILYMQQAQFNQLNLGMYINKGSFVLGSYFRQNSVNSDAVILLLGLRLPKLRIGFSYDATLSDARPGAKQSYEFSISFELKKKTPKKTLKAIKCPEF